MCSCSSPFPTAGATTTTHVLSDRLLFLTGELEKAIPLRSTSPRKTHSRHTSLTHLGHRAVFPARFYCIYRLDFFPFFSSRSNESANWYTPITCMHAIVHTLCSNKVTRTKAEAEKRRRWRKREKIYRRQTHGGRTRAASRRLTWIRAGGNHRLRSRVCLARMLLEKLLSPHTLFACFRTSCNSRTTRLTGYVYKYGIFKEKG